MKTTILITGGAGFIGSHLADELLAAGYAVRVLDVLSPQVHGPGRARPDGSRRAISIREVAERLARALGATDNSRITGQFRAGDIRHCFSDITKAREILGYRPQVDFGDGFRELAEWLKGQEVIDHGIQADRELEERGLMV